MTQVKIDEVLCLVCNVAAKISAHDTMPGRIIFLVKFLLDIGSDVLLYVVLLHGLCGAVNGILLHVLRHVCVLDHCLPVRHCDTSRRRVRAGPRGSSDGLRQGAGRGGVPSAPPAAAAAAAVSGSRSPRPSARRRCPPFELPRPPALLLAPAGPPAWFAIAPRSSALLCR